ncbi:unnamed protein product [Notodromas monacha]|uniref:Uncharacterized protein n=1 Tax=Notodromas monacha TaxID=399045 RepID=A0A7R9BCM1_9CRUS|nr:unnamed protein product [Notodromas monacha]CAG0912821.1 unnamed protein product [Notodromas monacha]
MEECSRKLFQSASARVAPNQHHTGSNGPQRDSLAIFSLQYHEMVQTNFLRIFSEQKIYALLWVLVVSCAIESHFEEIFLNDDVPEQPSTGFVRVDVPHHHITNLEDYFTKRTTSSKSVKRSTPRKKQESTTSTFTSTRSPRLVKRLKVSTARRLKEQEFTTSMAPFISSGGSKVGRSTTKSKERILEEFRAELDQVESESPKDGFSSIAEAMEAIDRNAKMLSDKVLYPLGASGRRGLFNDAENIPELSAKQDDEALKKTNTQIMMHGNNNNNRESVIHSFDENPRTAFPQITHTIPASPKKPELYSILQNNFPRKSIDEDNEQSDSPPSDETSGQGKNVLLETDILDEDQISKGKKSESLVLGLNEKSRSGNSNRKPLYPHLNDRTKHQNQPIGQHWSEKGQIQLHQKGQLHDHASLTNPDPNAQRVPDISKDDSFPQDAFAENVKSRDKPVLIGLIPYALMSNKPGFPKEKGRRHQQREHCSKVVLMKPDQHSAEQVHMQHAHQKQQVP